MSSLANLKSRIAKSHERIQNIYNSLQEELVVVQALQEDLEIYENGLDQGHIRGRKCGCGKIHPIKLVPRNNC